VCVVCVFVCGVWLVRVFVCVVCGACCVWWEFLWFSLLWLMLRCALRGSF
jgi:hypothetical protein